MKLTSLTILTLSLCLQIGLVYSMQNPEESKLTAEQRAAAADAKSEVAGAYELCDPEKLPAGVGSLVNQFALDPMEHAAALLKCHELTLGKAGEETTALTPLNTTQIAFGSYQFRDRTSVLKIVDRGAKSPVITELAHEPCKITSLAKINDTLIALGLEDGTIKLWNRKTNKAAAICKGQHADQIESLLLFSEQYLISASQGKVILWDLAPIDGADQNQPKHTVLSNDFSDRSILNKISDTEIAFGTAPQDSYLSYDNNVTIIDLSNIKKPTKKVIFIDMPSRRNAISSCVPCSSTVIACAPTNTNSGQAAITLFDLATRKRVLSIAPNFSMSFRKQVCPFSTYSFIASEIDNFRVICTKDLKRVNCPATIYAQHSCSIAFQLADMSVAFPDQEKLYIYEPHPAALAAYYELTLKDRVRLTALINDLSKQKKPLSLEKVQANTIFKSMPKAIQERVIENFNIKQTKGL